MTPETPEAVLRRLELRHARLELETKARKLGEQIAHGKADWADLNALEREAADAGLPGARRRLSEWVLLGVQMEHCEGEDVLRFLLKDKIASLGN